MADINTNINWYPGHMAKAKRNIVSALPNIDMVIELRDARAPISSANPDFKSLFGGKPTLTLLTKSALADPALTACYERQLSGGNIAAMAIDCKTGWGIKKINGAIRELMREKLARDAQRGIKRPIRAMVAGITNVGKSTFINTVCGERRAAAEDRPGVTRQNARISVPALGLELTDTPGLLWHKFEDKAVGMKLACLGSINDDIIDQTALCYDLIALISPRYSGNICERYGISIEEGDTAGEIFEKIARRRGFLCRGGIVDDERTARVVLDEFRAGKLGRITLDTE